MTGQTNPAPPKTNLPPQIASSNATAASFLSRRHQPSWMTGGPAPSTSTTSRPNTRPPLPPLRAPPARQTQPPTAPAPAPAQAVPPPPSLHRSPVSTTSNRRQSPAPLPVSAPQASPNPAPTTLPDTPISTSPLPITMARFVPDAGLDASVNPRLGQTSGGFRPPQGAPTPTQAPSNQPIPANNEPSPPAHLDFAALVRNVDDWIQANQANQNVAGPSQSIEVSRAQLLKKACLTKDYFFLVLHQIYCLVPTPLSIWSRDNLPAIKRALGILESIMRKNAVLSQAAVRWFAAFPVHINSLILNPYCKYALSQMEGFLVQLATNFNDLTNLCMARRYPFTVGEMERVLGCPSPTLQSILFTACRRRVGFADGTDAPGGKMDAIFAEDQEWYRRAARQRLPAAERAKWEARIAGQYRTLAAEVFPPMPPPQPQPLAVVSSPSPLTIIPPAGFFQLPTNGQMSPGLYQAANTVPQPPSIVPSNAPQLLPHGQLQYPAMVPPQDQQQFMQQLQQLQSNSLPSAPVTQFQQQQLQQISQVQQQQHQVQQQQHQVQQQQLQRQQQLQHQQTQQQPSPQQQFQQLQHPQAQQQQLQHQQLQQHQLQQRAQQHYLHALLPPAGYVIPSKEWPAQPYDERSAWMSLHQAHVRSPRRDAKHLPAGPERFYQAVKSLVAGPIPVPPLDELQEICFDVTTEDLALAAVAKVRTGDHLPTVECHSGSLRWRLRCCRVAQGSWSASRTVGEWLTLEVDWPQSLFMFFNDTHALETRRRTHNKKDLPVELTDFVTHGTNRIKISLPPAPGLRSDPTNRFFAVEILEVLSHSHVVQRVWDQGVIPADETLQIVRQRLSSSAEDDGVIIEAPYVSIDLADPFMSRIFSVPVRGVECAHLECFDLDTWLQTRPVKPGPKCRHHLVKCDCAVPTEPSVPDKWACPICGKDARPYNLRIDGFLLMVRGQLEKQNKLNTKSVHVMADGTWTVVVEDDDDGDLDDDGPRATTGTSTGTRSISAAPAAAPRREVEIIEID
ncbi:zinc finger MIZ domain-containing protein 2 [Podospora conica]|nr:zinc finger MIZ domain-containing protein 2 [Schizothecium conicum]